MRAREFIKESREEVEGLTIEMTKHGHQLVINALDDWGNKLLGHVIFNIGDNNELDPQELEVVDQYQGQGIAKVMYDYAKSKGYTIHRSYDQTDAGKGFWNKHRGEDVRVWESTNTVTNQQVWDYVGEIHPKDQQGGGFLKRLIMRHPQYELKRVPLSSINIPDQELDDEEQQEPYDPYGRAMFVDPEHAGEYSQYHIDKRPIVIDTRGNILDGSHRAWAAAMLMNKKDIMAYVPVPQLNELGDSPSEYKPNRKRKRSLFHATVDGNWVDVFFDRSEFNGTLHITFTVNGDYDTPSQPTSASKSTVKILSTVLNIIKKQLPEYITKARPPGISFTSKENNRANLYRKYFVPVIQNILGSKWQYEEYPSMGMTVFHWKPVKKQDMSENTQLPGDFKLMGQNLFLKNLARNLKQRYPDATVKLSSDRVVAYHNKGDDEALSVMGTEVMDSGYIGVGLDDAFTESFQGVLVPTIKQTTEQLLAANPGTKPALFLSTDNWNPDAWTHIATKLGYRLVADDEQLDENFADGKNPRRVKQEIEEFLDSLSPDDVGVEEFPGYRIHYEGFTDDCKSSIDYQRNPDKVYQQVYNDFIKREGGRKPVKSSMVGDEEYPILYSVFKVPQSKTIDTAEKAYNIAYKKKQPWPRGSREEKLIRSDWQLSGLYDQYVLKQNVTEAFNQPYDIQWSQGDHGDYDAYAELDDGSGLEIAFLDQQHNSWMVDFFRDNSTEITGEGDAYRVFATVLTAMRQFIDRQHPAKLNFSAEKQDDPKGSRARLYDRMIQRYISSTGYNLTKENYPDGAVYTLTRIEQE